MSNISRVAADAVYNMLKAYIKTSTRKNLYTGYGYIFDGRISSCVGQQETSLYTVYRSSSVYCGKVFTNARASFELERDVAVRVQSIVPCESLIKVIKSIDIDAERKALIIDLYPRSASDYVNCHKLSDEAVTKIGFCVLAAMIALHECGYSHCDIKPGNIMLCGASGKAVLIDLGACVKMGSGVVQCTKPYPLDACDNPISPEFDLCCLASTIFKLLIEQDTAATTKKDLRFLLGHYMHKQAAQMAMLCLGENTSASQVWDMSIGHLGEHKPEWAAQLQLQLRDMKPQRQQQQDVEQALRQD